MVFNIWLTGLSGSGKTTLAIELSKLFQSINIPHEVLDGDVYRTVLSPTAGYTEMERNEFRQKIIHITKLLNKHGVSCILPLLSSNKKVRNNARKKLKNYIEVYVKCPIDVCIKRDPKNLYRNATNNKEPSVVGLDIPYEEPDTPDLIVETNNQSIDSCIRIIVGKIEELGFI